MSILDLSGVVDSFALPNGIFVERFAVDAYDSEGFLIENTAVLVPFKAVVHVDASFDLQNLEEGERNLETIIIFTQLPLKTSDSSTKIKADIVQYNNKRYRIILAEDWLLQSGHYRYWAQLVEEK